MIKPGYITAKARGYAELPLPDEIHPAPAGHRRIGENFTRLVFGDGGPFAPKTR